MIPILYYGNETRFTSNGIGRLTEIISCEVTEERNGIYEVEFTYPAEGRFYNLLVSMAEAYAVGARNSQGIIACIHDDKHDIQPFDIYGYSAPIDGIATFYAHHISYRLEHQTLRPLLLL
jgi:phage-related protein